jgi:ferredoxin-NADP reductase
MSFFWREWWIYHVIESEIQMMPMVKHGLGAWSVLIWIVISSFAPIRNLRYEAFVIQHIISFVTFVTLLLLHVPSYAKVYIWSAIGFYAFDRTVRTLRVLYQNLSILHRRPSSSWLCKAHITALPGQTTRITIKNPPMAQWSPGQHVFLSFPAISPLQSHPFTVSSSPLSRPLELSFVVRAHAGFSRRLYNKATTSLPTNNRPGTQFSVILDGPYGRPPNVLQYDTVVLIAGSTGASFTVPILLHALQSSQPNCIRRIQFVWVVKFGSNFEWFADEIMEAANLAADRGIQLDLLCCVTCDPTYTANFPVRIRALDKCSCTDNSVPLTASFTIGAPDDKSVDHERADSISSSTEFSSTRDLCQCHCTGSPHPIRASSGRPDIRAVLVQGLELAQGETGVAVCGPEGLMSRTRCLVAELSDERAADKGSGAYGVAMFAEGFGW